LFVIVCTQSKNAEKRLCMFVEEATTPSYQS